MLTCHLVARSRMHPAIKTSAHEGRLPFRHAGNCFLLLAGWLAGWLDGWKGRNGFDTDPTGASRPPRITVFGYHDEQARRTSQLHRCYCAHAKHGQHWIPSLALAHPWISETCQSSKRRPQPQALSYHLAHSAHFGKRGCSFLRRFGLFASASFQSTNRARSSSGVFMSERAARVAWCNVISLM